MPRYENVWNDVDSFNASIGRVDLKQERTVIHFDVGLIVDDMTKPNEIPQPMSDVDIIFYDVAYCLYDVTGYQKDDTNQVIWDKPIIEEKTYRSRTSDDNECHLGGTNLLVRNGQSWCSIEIHARRMEVIAL